MYKRKKSFSLIELLVVIAILAILASMISPSLKRSLENASYISCKSNYKQLFLIIDFYLNDFEHYPIAMVNNKGDDKGGIIWDDIFGMNYDGRGITLQSSKKYQLPASQAGAKEALEVYVCPSDQNVLLDSTRARRSYSYNAYQYSGDREGFSNAWDSGERWTASIFEVPDPTGTMILGERTSYMGGMSGAIIANPNWQSSAPQHWGEYNYLFSDGHSEKFDKEETRNPNKGYWNAGRIWTRKAGD